MKRYIRSAISSILDEPETVQEEIARATSNVEDLRILLETRPMDKTYNYTLCADIARNPNADIDILMSLIDHPARYVRAAVASNPNTTVDMLWKLSDDDEDQVLLGILANPNVSEDIVKKLANSNNANVKLDALKNWDSQYLQMLLVISQLMENHINYFITMFNHIYKFLFHNNRRECTYQYLPFLYAI